MQAQFHHLRLLFLVALFVSCSSKPKVIAPTSTPKTFHGSTSTIVDQKNEIHEVVVEDFLDASRYTYLYVKENDNKFWIAIPQTEVEKGETYFYQGGILMHNFESKEHDRTFDTLYLVGGISKEPDQPSTSIGQGYIDMHGGKSEVRVLETEPVAGGVSLSNLFANPATYSGKLVKVKGTCVKINKNIMGKNWIHIRDGSKDAEDNQLDLTISTMDEIAEGSVVVFEGTIATDRDFGSGYKYDIIMEDAKVLD